MTLSAAQQAAIERTDQDVCCVAGPGSGKTRVLVERFAWLARTTARPEAILAITFTKKAAQEIKTRLVKHFLDKGNDDLRRRVERAQVSTIHGFCEGLLSEFALDAGLDPAHRLMDEYEAPLEHARAVEAALNRFSRERSTDFQTLVESWSSADIAADIASMSEKLRYAGGAEAALATLPEYHPAESLAAIVSALVDGIAGSNAQTLPQIAARDAVRAWLEDSSTDPVRRLLKLLKLKLPVGKPVAALNAALKAARELAQSGLEEAVGERNLPALATLRSILIACEHEYRTRKRRLGVLDFTDLEEQTVALLESNESIRKLVSERFDAILMDELQDTNPIQWRIVNAIRREGRFFAVGDINQSIFGWRGADPEQFRLYQVEFSNRAWQIERLQENYRSREAILKAVERVCVASELAGIQSHTLQAGRLFSTPCEICLEVIRAENDSSEAASVAHRILELKHAIRVGDPPRPLRFSDIAILSRGAVVFDDYEAALRAAGVPCRVQRGRNFFAEPEIVDLTNLLRVLVNPENEPAMLGLLRSPLVGVTDEEMFLRHEAGLSLAPEPFLLRLNQLRAIREDAPIDSLLMRFLDESGHWGRLTEAQRANVRKLLRILRTGAASRQGSLAIQLEEIEGIRASGRENNAPAPGAEDAVQMLTVHGAKGLEFPVVFLVSMHKAPGGKSKKPSLELSQARGLGALWRIEGQDETQQDGALRAAEEARKIREAAEEDRLLYVAMTRAEERLILVWSDKKRVAQHWLAPLAAGLGLDWNVPVGIAVEQNGVRLLRAGGETTPLEPEDNQSQACPETVFIQPAPIALPEPPSVSATVLAHFAACPRRYFLHTLLGWPETFAAPQILPLEDDEDPAPTQARGANFGDEVHQLLAGAKLPAASREARDLVRKFELSETGRRAARASRSARETPVLFDYEGLLIRGVIDLWFQEGGELVLVDYKTDQHISDERLLEYSMQLRLYAIALSRGLGRRVNRIVIAALRAGREIQVELSPEHERELVLHIARFREAHRTGDFLPLAGKQCEWCPYLAGACPQAGFADSERF